MDYSVFEAEDLVMDASFRNFCVGNNEKDTRFWEAWVQLHPEKEKTIQEAREMYYLLNGNLSATDFTTHRDQFLTAATQHINNSVVHTEAAPIEISIPERRGFKKAWLYAGVAATVALIIFLTVIPKKEKEQEPVALRYSYTQVSNAGERKSFQLPDGSKVMLNAGSRIDIAKDFNTNTREVFLSGEAFFDVAHNPGKPFLIHTAAMEVKVLGTIFNVKAYPSDKISETSLLKGSVEVTLLREQGKKVRLTPNQKIVLSNTPKQDTLQVKKSAAAQPPPEDFTIKGLTYDKTDHKLAEVSWTENRLCFNDNSFESVATELERWYNITIRFDNEQVKNYRFTAVFDQKNIVQVLDALQLSRRFEYRIAADNNIIISK